MPESANDGAAKTSTSVAAPGTALGVAQGSAPDGCVPPTNALPEATRQFYLRSLDLLDQSGIRYTVGGAYCLAGYAGIVRHTKDLDVFVRPADRDRVLQLFGEHGYRTEITHPHWVAKAFDPNKPEPARDNGNPGTPQEKPDFVDIIYASGNGPAVVDELWLDHAERGDVLGRPGGAPLTAPEEIIWSKAFVMERERFDGADIAHLILARGHALDWARLLTRFRGYERVLLGHLVFFGFIYPSEQSRVPKWVIERLIDDLRAEPPTSEKFCRGTLLSWSQYLPDVRARGFIDARLQPHGHMTQKEIDRWTNAEK